METLKENFLALIGQYSKDATTAKQFWEEIETCYTAPKRYYHTLKHLDYLLKTLTGVQQKIKDWETVLFATYYHDIIYNPGLKDNEQRSALLAEKRLRQISVPAINIKKVNTLILATAAHTASDDDDDVNYFTDADLAILGSNQEFYFLYCKQIRKEFWIYPSYIYKPGRKKVLAHFIQMPRIFKTDEFYYKYEAQARQNLKQELEML